MIAKPISAFCFGIVLISSLDGPVAPLLMLTQSEIRIPSDAQLERLEREGIATPTLDVSGAPAIKGTEESQDQQMERQSRAIDQKVTKGICSDSYCCGGLTLQWCSRHRPFRLLGVKGCASARPPRMSALIANALFSFVLLTYAPAGAWAQAPEAAPPAQVRELLKLLSEPKVRSWLEDELKRVPAQNQTRPASLSRVTAERI